MVTELENQESLETSPKSEKVNVTSDMVLKRLATKVDFPANYIKKEAIKLYSNRWRVNIWTVGNNNARVEKSWFVITDNNGDVVSFS